MDLNHYLQARYVDGGRGRGQYDCWGLVRDVLHREFNTPLLASFGHVKPQDKKSFTESSRLLLPYFTPCDELAEGVVLLAYHGLTLRHVGICVLADGHKKILHAHMMGMRLDTYRNFERRCNGNRVELIKYTGLSDD